MFFPTSCLVVTDLRFFRTEILFRSVRVTGDCSEGRFKNLADLRTGKHLTFVLIFSGIFMEFQGSQSRIKASFFHEFSVIS